MSSAQVTIAEEPETGIVARLRGRPDDRPAVDDGLAGGLRAWLEDGLAGPAAEMPDGILPVRVTKQGLSEVLRCEAHHDAGRRAPRRLSVDLARGTLVDAAFRQWVTTGALGDPWQDALAAVQADGDRGALAAFVASLPADRRRSLAQEVREQAATVRADWPPLAASWMARTQERLLVPLAGGRLVLSGVLDLALGAPSAGRASVCIVEVKSGRRRVTHRADLHFYALLETLRSGAAPFRVATYYANGGALDVEPVSEDILVGSLERVLAGAERLCRLASGAEPTRTPNPLCSWCTALPDCAVGRQHSGRERALEAEEP